MGSQPDLVSCLITPSPASLHLPHLVAPLFSSFVSFALPFADRYLWGAVRLPELYECQSFGLSVRPTILLGLFGAVEALISIRFMI